MSRDADLRAEQDRVADFLAIGSPHDFAVDHGRLPGFCMSIPRSNRVHFHICASCSQELLDDVGSISPACDLASVLPNHCVSEAQNFLALTALCLCLASSFIENKH